MSIRVFVLSLLLLIIPFHLIAADTAVDLEESRTRVDRLFAKWDAVDSPGAAVLVQLHGEDVYRKCFGMANLELRVPISVNTSFDLASVSKHLTSFAVLSLVNDGELKLEDDIHRYLPELPDFCKEVTVRDLLYQSSGLWEFWSILNTYSGFKNRDYFTMNDVFNLLAHQDELLFEPGTKYAYTNTNYALLSEVVARATGDSFGDWTKENVFVPLGMDVTHFQEDCSRLIPNKASAYRSRGGELVHGRPSNVEIPGSAHAFSTLDDMSKWLDNFRTKKLGGDAVFDKMFTYGALKNGQPISYSAGLIVKYYKGAEIVEHSGQTGGYKTMLVYCPDKELGIVILANERSINAYGLSHDILDIFLGVGEEKTSTNQKPSDDDTPVVDAAIMDKYAGGYKIEETGQLVGFFRDGDWLLASYRGLGKEYYTPRSQTQFVDYSGRSVLEFETDDTGEAAKVTIVIDDDKYVALIVDAHAAGNPSEDVTGDYYCEALGASCAVRETEGRIVLSHRRYGDMDMFLVDTDQFVGSWGFMSFRRDAAGSVVGFDLSDEIFDFKDMRFARVVD
jgi:CubicO group peptidase (beta-lactamase class C family)